jgi:hypothetical protein
MGRLRSRGRGTTASPVTSGDPRGRPDPESRQQHVRANLAIFTRERRGCPSAGSVYSEGGRPGLRAIRVCLRSGFRRDRCRLDGYSEARLATAPSIADSQKGRFVGRKKQVAAS